MSDKENKNWWITKSFTASKDGGSARKLSAFYAVVIMAGFVTVYFSNDKNATTMVAVWLIFASLCLGMVTAQQLIELKSGNKKEDATKEP